MKGASRQDGFTLIEVLIDAFVITAIFGVLVGSFLFVLKAVYTGQVRSQAVALANEQMETLRNMSYDSLSTVGGTILPQGAIPDSQTVNRGGANYTLETTIIYIDDPFDGCLIAAGGGFYQCTDGATSVNFDPVPVDYKRIRIQVKELGKSVIFATLVSNAAAKAAETGSNTGILVIKLIDASGLPIAGATVTITNPSTGVSVTGVTNASGYLVVAGLPPDQQNGYHLVATKDGFSTDYTTPRTAQNPNQVQPDVDIIAQQVTTQTLAIDRLATMTVAVRNEIGALVFGATVTATSSKITQFNPDLPKNIYTQLVDASGNAIFTNIEWDSYSLTVTPQAGNLYLVTTIPYQKVSVAPNGAVNATTVVTTDPSWPIIDSVSPIAASVGQTIDVQIEGSNFPVGITTVKLRRLGYADVIPTGLVITANEKTITATFNFTGVAGGSWDLIIDVSGKIINQTGGFTLS